MDMVIAIGVSLSVGLTLGVWLTVYVYDRSFQRNPDDWLEIIHMLRRRRR